MELNGMSVFSQVNTSSDCLPKWAREEQLYNVDGYNKDFKNMIIDKIISFFK